MWAREAKRNGPRELGFEREENSRKSAVNRGSERDRVCSLRSETTEVKDKACILMERGQKKMGTIWEIGEFLAAQF